MVTFGYMPPTVGEVRAATKQCPSCGGPVEGEYTLCFLCKAREARGITPADFGAQPDAPTENLKKRHGDRKRSFTVIPFSALRVQADAHQFGADKYGELNWRKDPVDVKTYCNAMLRHLMDFMDGEDCAPDSGISHLGHIAAGCNILIDAQSRGELIDNRALVTCMTGPNRDVPEQFEVKLPHSEKSEVES